ncbi:DUF72 domain-containing protein [candidate division WS5 bacterium]|uniref:DUF72 domain-containing protein n=1 Tax=candidate division WS5 bacterium TaxID=2093353 RepID=A0A419DFQ0_9BACT|nr:MAG: DUF72 domain-containing protein [candidate division WS5 bacterium]
MAIYIGTSGFSYHHWAEKFYPKSLRQSDWLSFYSKRFGSVELNVSFYRLPSEGSFKKWHSSTPEGFRFAVKGSRYITHTKRLLATDESVKIFFERAKNLREKLSVVLWQLPPSFKADPERLEDFLKILKKYRYRNAFEFRDESWFTDEVYAILKKYNAALVISDSPDFPKEEVYTCDFSYLRFHGGKYLYSSKYAPKEMKEFGKKIERLAQRGDVYAYFNNDANAYAVKNALELKGLLDK